MLIFERDGDLVLELFYYCLKIAMNKFLELMIPDSTPSRSSCTTSPTENEIITPTAYLTRSNGRKFCHRKRLQFDSIVELSDDLILTSDSQQMEAQSLNSAKAENKSNISFNKNLEEFKISTIHQRMVHSSPKLVTSHFYDSGFLNCSIETSSQFHSTVEDSQQSVEKSTGHEISLDSCIPEDHSHSWLKVGDKSAMNRNSIATSGVKNSEEINVRDFDNGRDIRSVQNQSTSF